VHQLGDWGCLYVMHAMAGQPTHKIGLSGYPRGRLSKLRRERQGLMGLHIDVVIGFKSIRLTTLAETFWHDALSSVVYSEWPRACRVTQGLRP